MLSTTDEGTVIPFVTNTAVTAVAATCVDFETAALSKTLANAESLNIDLILLNIDRLYPLLD